MDGFKKAISLSLIVTYVLFVASFYSTPHVSAQEKSPTSTLTLTLGKNTAVLIHDDKQELIVTDNLGSTRLVQNSNGDIQEQSHYPYGGKRPQPFGQAKIPTDKYFTGHRELEDLTTYHAGARFYSPVLSTFIQPDKVEAPNRYQYVKNNPVMLTDPTGNCATCNHTQLSASSTYAPTMGYDNSGRTLSDADRLLQENPEEFWNRTKQLYLFGGALVAPAAGPIIVEAGTAGFVACASNLVACHTVAAVAADFSLGDAAPPTGVATLGLNGIDDTVRAFSAEARANPIAVRADALAADIFNNRNSFEPGANQVWGYLDDLIQDTGKIGKRVNELTDMGRASEQGLRPRLANGTYIYVQDAEGRIIIATHAEPRSPHSSFVGGESLPVAGEIRFKGGKVEVLNTASGHYRPPAWRLSSVYEELDRLGVQYNATGSQSQLFGDYLGSLKSGEAHYPFHLKQQ